MATDNQKKIQEATEARAKELREFEGKFFSPNESNPRFPNQVIKVLNYAGVGAVGGGVSAHFFRVESFNPGKIWRPAATQFLAEHHEIEAPKQSEQKEAI